MSSQILPFIIFHTNNLVRFLGPKRDARSKSLNLIPQQERKKQETRERDKDSERKGDEQSWKGQLVQCPWSSQPAIARMMPQWAAGLSGHGGGADGAAYKGTRSENNLQLFEANTQMRSNQLSNWPPSDCSDCEARRKNNREDSNKKIEFKLK